MKTFTTAFIKANCGCYNNNGDLSKLQAVYKEEDKTLCYETEDCTVTVQEVLDSSIPLKDKYWFFCKKVFTKEQNQRIAIAVAECVLPIYEKKYTDNKAPREAIEAAKLYLAGNISLGQLITVRRVAADAAYAYAADAAAYTAKLEQILQEFVNQIKD